MPDEPGSDAQLSEEAKAADQQRQAAEEARLRTEEEITAAQPADGPG